MILEHFLPDTPMHDCKPQTWTPAMDRGFVFLSSQMLGFGSKSMPTTSEATKYQKAHALLANPRLSQVLSLKSGQQVSYAEVGDRNGTPCVWIAGPCSNRFIIALYSDACIELGIRLICFDRPGRGASSLVNFKEWTFSSFAGIHSLTRHSGRSH